MVGSSRHAKRTGTSAAAAILWLALAGACSKGGGAAASDGATDGSSERPAVLCSTIDASAENEDGGPWMVGTDEFGPNALAAKAASSLGRVNVYEVASPRLLERVDVYVRSDLVHTRLTIAVQEAVSRTAAFRKLTDVQIEMPTCEGWASSGPLDIPLESGRFYAVGLDPNQPVTSFVVADSDTLPIDGAFGRLIGSKASTSVSVPTITWEKFSDKEYNRQRLVTSPRDGGASPTDAAAADGGDAAADGARDGGAG